jgi:hypothetical protein
MIFGTILLAVDRPPHAELVHRLAGRPDGVESARAHGAGAIVLADRPALIAR